MTAVAYEPDDSSPADTVTLDRTLNLLSLSCDELRALRLRIERLDEWLLEHPAAPSQPER